MLLLTVLIANSSLADEGFDKVRMAIQARDSSSDIGSVEKSAVSGLYLTQIDGVSGYVTEDGRYFVVGDMLDLASHENVTEEGRKAKRRAVLKSADPNDAIVFAPAKPKYTIIVFTDVDCPYCRKLHSEIGQLNERGIVVRYTAFPRSGPNAESWRRMEAVWCSSDRHDALTRATFGKGVGDGGRVQFSDSAMKSDSESCRGNAQIARQYAFGQQLGIPGTPTIVFSDRTFLGGYVSPDELAAAVAEHDAGGR